VPFHRTLAFFLSVPLSRKAYVRIHGMIAPKAAQQFKMPATKLMAVRK
jgi:hypothetical protein